MPWSLPLRGSGIMRQKYSLESASLPDVRLTLTKRSPPWLNGYAFKATSALRLGLLCGFGFSSSITQRMNRLPSDNASKFLEKPTEPMRSAMEPIRVGCSVVSRAPTHSCAPPANRVRLFTSGFDDHDTGRRLNRVRFGDGSAAPHRNSLPHGQRYDGRRSASRINDSRIRCNPNPCLVRTEFVGWILLHKDSASLVDAGDVPSDRGFLNRDAFAATERRQIARCESDFV